MFSEGKKRHSEDYDSVTCMEQGRLLRKKFVDLKRTRRKTYPTPYCDEHGVPRLLLGSAQPTNLFAMSST